MTFGFKFGIYMFVPDFGIEDNELKSTIKGQQTLSKILSNEPDAMNKASEGEECCTDFKRNPKELIRRL